MSRVRPSARSAPRKGRFVGSPASSRFTTHGLLLALLASAAGCGGAQSAAKEAPTLQVTQPVAAVVPIPPGTYFPDWPSLAAPGEREYDESRSIEARREKPPQGPDAQVPMRALAGQMP